MSRESQHTHLEDKIQEQVRLWGFPPTCASLVTVNSKSFHSWYFIWFLSSPAWGDVWLHWSHLFQALLGHLDRKLGHLERQQHQLMDASLGVKVSIHFLFWVGCLSRSADVYWTWRYQNLMKSCPHCYCPKFSRQAWPCKVRPKQFWPKGWSRKLVTSAAITQVQKHNPTIITQNIYSLVFRSSEVYIFVMHLMLVGLIPYILHLASYILRGASYILYLFCTIPYNRQSG